MSCEGENAEATAIATEPEPMLEEAMQNIFAACDADNQGAVPTAKLIEYISPFMAYNRTELMQLQEMLDPQDTNVLVSKEKFYAVMNVWANRITSANESENFLEAVPRDFYKIEEEDCPFVQSTPRSSFGHQFLKGYAVSGITNISLFSECSAITPDKAAFEERLKELTHQNRKLTEELSQAKVQLTSSEEYIETLQADLNHAVKKLNCEQQTNEQLQKCVEESDTIKEVTGDVMLQYNQLKKEKDLLEKENATLKESLDALDDEKNELVELVEKYRKGKNDLERKLLEAEKEVQVSDEKVNEMEEAIARLKVDIKELQSVEESYKQSSEELLAENQTLQKLLHKFQLQQTTSGISPLEKIRQHCTVFNSPKLVKQLSNPLSPLANTPPEFVCAVKASTPNQTETLLDDSIPADLANISVLSPQAPIQSATYVVENSVEAQKSVESVRNNTSEEDYWKVNLTQILESHSPHNSLQAEIAEVVNKSCLSGNECVHLIRLADLKNDYLRLQQQKTELENLQKQNADHSNDSVHSNSSTTYFTEVRMHLDQDAHLKNEIQQLRLKLNVVQQDNEKLAKRNQENRNKCDCCMVNLQKIGTLYDALKTEMRALLAENGSLKEIFTKNAQLKQQIDDLQRQYVAERVEWQQQKVELQSRVDEVTVVQQKNDVCERNEKGVRSFSRMQMKLDKMQEKIDNLEDLVRNKNKELQLYMNKEVAMKSESSALKQKLSETVFECNQFALKLVQANAFLQNSEIEISAMKEELKRLTGNVVELKERELSIMDAVHCIYECNVDMVSLLKEAILSHCVNSPLIFALNSSTDSLNKNSHRLDLFRLNLQFEQPTFDGVLEMLTEHVKDLREMVLFNKQFTQTLKNLLQEINCKVFVKSSNVKSLESPDSPSLNDENTVVVQEDYEKIEDTVLKKENEDDLSSSDIEKWSLSSDCKILANFEEISFNRAFPNLSDALLKSLNIENTPSNRIVTVNDKETAEKYTILMTILATDALSIKQRHENQTQLLNERKERFLNDLKTLIIAKESTQITLMKDIIRDFYRICAAAEMLGALQEEVKVHKCLQLIESRVNRNVEMQKQQQVTRTVTRFHHLQKVTYQKTAKIIQLPNKYIKNGTHFIGSQFEKSKCKSSSLKKFGKGIWRFFCYGVCILIFLTIFTILGSTVSDMILNSDNDSSRLFCYPFKYLFWDELLAPISKKVYCVKECPH